MVDNDQWGVLDSTNTYQIGNLKAEVAGPGEVSTWYHDTNTNNVPTHFHGSGTDEAIYDDIWYVGYDWGIYNIWLEFARLGTYTVKQTIKAKYDNDTTDSTDPIEYTDTETYTFHVGPMVDLEVRDGGASSYVAADQHALKIVAINNGPNDAGSTQVTGLPTEAEVLYQSQGTGSYDGSNGVWNIGELKVRDYYRSQGEPEPTLVLSATAEETANVSIANLETNYEVCISSSFSERRTLPHTNRADCKGRRSHHQRLVHRSLRGHRGRRNRYDVHHRICVQRRNGPRMTEDVCAAFYFGVRTNRTEAECEAGSRARCTATTPATTRPPSPPKREPAGLGKACRCCRAQTTLAPASP